MAIIQRTAKTRKNPEAGARENRIVVTPTIANGVATKRVAARVDCPLSVDITLMLLPNVNAPELRAASREASSF